MPVYDFRCADCGSQREVRAPIDQAGSLTLVCVGCGGAMTKALSASVAIITGSAGTAAPSPNARRGRRPRGHTCSDGAIKLTRPNPFTAPPPPRAGDG